MAGSNGTKAAAKKSAAKGGVKPPARPSVAIPIAPRTSSAVSAIAALDQTARPEETPASVAAPAATAHTPPADEKRSDAPAAATPPASPVPAGPAAPLTGKVKDLPAKPVALHGQAFSGLNRDQMRVLLATQHNELLELRAKTLKQEKAAAAEPLFDAEDLEEGVAELFAMGGEGAALIWGDECELDEKEQRRMGRVWATPAQKLIQKYADKDPDNAALIMSFLIAGTATGALVLKKARRVKARRAQERAAAERDRA